MTEYNNPIDWQDLMKITNNKPELAKEMIGMLSSELPSMQQNISLAYNGKDYAKLLDYIHKLHGSCCYCGVPTLKAITADIESYLKKQEHDKLPQLIPLLNQEIKHIVDFVQQEKIPV